MTTNEGQPTCSTISRDRSEPLFGTAPRADVWLLLTYGGAFGSRAFEESDLPAPVRDHLEAALQRIPNARLQLISPRPGQDGDLIEFVVANGREVDPFYRLFELTRYEELLDVDLEAALGSDSTAGSLTQQEPLYLVCTNGRRDPCCAQHGLPVFHAFHSSLGDRVRQSSHVGGHRFAANVLSFPHGLCFGRVRPDDVEGLLEAGQQGRIGLDWLRGRACYDRPVQAAEILLRREIGNDALGAYRLRDQQQLAEDRWKIGFEDPSDGRLHDLELQSIVSEDLDRLSCWSDKLAPVTSYELQSHSVVS